MRRSSVCPVTTARCTSLPQRTPKGTSSRGLFYVHAGGGGGGVRKPNPDSVFIISAAWRPPVFFPSTSAPSGASPSSRSRRGLRVCVPSEQSPTPSSVGAGNAFSPHQFWALTVLSQSSFHGVLWVCVTLNVVSQRIHLHHRNFFLFLLNIPK